MRGQGHRGGGAKDGAGRRPRPRRAARPRVRLPGVSAASSRRSRSRRWAMYSLELCRGVVNRRAVAWAEDGELALRGAARARQIAGQCPRIRGDEHAPLAQHGVPGQRRRAQHEGQMIRRVSGRRDRLSGPKRSPSASRASTSPRAAASGAAGNRSRIVPDRFGVVDVIVGQGDPGQASPRSRARRSAPRDGPGAPGRDRPATRVAADDPGVRAGQRERSGIGGPDPQVLARAVRSGSRPQSLTPGRPITRIAWAGHGVRPVISIRGGAHGAHGTRRGS